MPEEYSATSAEVSPDEKLKPGEILARVEGESGGRPFTAGFIYDTARERVVRAAPIIFKAINGKTRTEIRAMAGRVGWKIAIVNQGAKP